MDHCAICNQIFHVSKLMYFTRYCGCWKGCTHGICAKCDQWQDKLKPGPQKDSRE